MHELRPFPGEGDASPQTVGGKGASLIRMLDAGFRVPPGAVLTTSFFESWFEQVLASAPWQAVEKGDPSSWSALCPAAKSFADTLTFTSRQLSVLSELEMALDGDKFAVRSSSPEEDLATASFAGGYETVLGVPRKGLQAAIRRCFVSALDARVLHYKAERGFDPLVPRIAVVVQAQIPSDVAGVGFSLNPLNNDYDEAVIDASWGLGETVVSGAVTPDHFVVDKVSRRVLVRDLGAKQYALHVADHGLEQRERDRSDSLCLTDAQLAELTETITAIEILFGKPMDIEFAYADAQLHVLQARPITTWIPIPEELRTRPGETRRLWMDLALSTGFTINVPVSPMGISWLSTFIGKAVESTIGFPPFELEPKDLLWRLVGGRMYQDLSAALWISTPELLAMNQESVDALMADTLRAVDAKRYRAPNRPKWLHPWVVFAYLRAVWRLRALLFNGLLALVAPATARERLDAEVLDYEDDLRSVPPETGLWDVLEQKTARVVHQAYGVTFAALGVGMGALVLAQRLVPKRLAHLADHLGRGFEGNAVIEMGLAMHAAAQHVPADLRSEPEALNARLETRDLPASFLAAWDAFLHRYGWRGPAELDLGRPRYVDEPVIALRQICAMSTAAEAFDPAAAQELHVRTRRETMEHITAEVGPIRRWLLRWAHRRIELLAFARDLPKHNFLMVYQLLYPRLLDEGRRLVAAGRLDRPHQVFGLSLEDLRAAESDPGLDLRARHDDNTRFNDLLESMVKGFPMVIDSRGRITRAKPKPAKPGELIGAPISPGVVRGPVKVLNSPDDKPVLPGDILVAYTTDPGWTPLFVNAAAIVLEVGGRVQHGAIVAREYGKPCVGGISDVLTRFEDGQIVEVDGNAGVVRVSLSDG